jgi:hypothetical protein
MGAKRTITGGSLSPRSGYETMVDLFFDDLSNADVRTGADDINLVMVEITTQGDARKPFFIKDVRGVTRDCSACEVLTGLDIHNDVVRQFALEGGDGDIKGDTSEDDKGEGEHGGVETDGHLLRDVEGEGEASKDDKGGGGDGEGDGEASKDDKGGEGVGEGDGEASKDDKGGEGGGEGDGEGDGEASKDDKGGDDDGEGDGDVSKEEVGGVQHGGVEDVGGQQGVEVSRATVALLALNSGTGLNNSYNTDTTQINLPPPPSDAFCETSSAANVITAQAILKAAKRKAKEDRKRQRGEDDAEVDSVAELQNKLKAAKTERKPEGRKTKGSRRPK